MNEAQAIGAIMAMCFIFIALLNKSSTYTALAGGYVINAAVHWIFEPVPAWSAWWPALYSSIDVLALCLIATLGDIRVKLQIWLLSALVTMHGLLAWDLIYETSIVFSNYYRIVMTIIAAQIIAGFWDATTGFRRISSAGHSSDKRGYHGKNHNQSA